MSMAHHKIAFVLRLFAKNHPSTYTMSKAIAEDLVINYPTEVPVVVVRPSIITSSYADPEAGFVEGFQVKTRSHHEIFLL